MRLPDEAVGKRIRCKSCDTVIDILGIPDEPEPTPLDEPASDGIALPISVPSAPGARTLRSIPPEPWYYAFLVAYAWGCILLAIGQFVLALALEASKTGPPGQPHPPFSMAVIGSSFALMVGAILISCPILLVVDIARNVRATRYQS